MSKWMNKFLEKARTDNTDKSTPERGLSVMSVPIQRSFSENSGNSKNNLLIRTDNTDRLERDPNMSGLSGPSDRYFSEKYKKLKNNVPILPDKTDKLERKVNLSGLSDHFLDKNLLKEDFEERLAIAGYDGHTSPEQAKKIAYQDAFIAALTSLPAEDDKASLQDWLHHRIQAAHSYLTTQDFALFAHKETTDHGL